jgi:two-component system, LuxR family, response regulator FixJ
MGTAITMSEDRPRIFVVEDDRSVRESFVRQFHSVGWLAEGFASAREFLQRPCYRGIGCVLLDVRLPDAQGLELHSEMLARAMNLPVIFVSAFGDVPTAIAAIRKGAVDFLVKPVDEAVLFGAIRQALARHAALRYTQSRCEVIRGRLASLTARQREVLRLVIDGRINKQIAERLGIATKTVKAHRGAAMHKMGFRSVTVLLHALEEARQSIPQPEPAAASPERADRFAARVRHSPASVALLPAG